jgi:hypothetical protein
MWCHSDLALALHRARLAGTAAGSRPRRQGKAMRVAVRPVLQPVPAPWAR